MNLFRAIATRFHRQTSGLEVLTSRLLEDAGIERKERRTLIGSMMVSFTPSYLVETIRR